MTLGPLVGVPITLVELAARPKGGEGVKSGPIALATILVLCIVAYFLFKSMSKHLKKVRDEFPKDPSAPQPPEGTDQPPAETDEASPPAKAPPPPDSSP